MRMCVWAVLIGLVIVAGSTVSVGTQQPESTVEVVVDSGPHAGTYKLPSHAPCMGDAKDFRGGYDSNLEAMYDEGASKAAIGARTLTSVTVMGRNFDASGASKTGHAWIIFGPHDQDVPDPKLGTKYESQSPDGVGTYRLARTGTGATLSFDGQNAKGTRFRVTVNCRVVM